jgi:hypothetical protein
MNTNCIHTSKASVVTFLLTGIAVTSLFISGKPVQAQSVGNNSQSRVSAVVTSILSNGTTNRFASEIVFPQGSISPSGDLTIKIIYGSVGNDPSQVAIIKGNMNAGTVNYPDNTIQAAIARAIDTAINDHRLGDIIGIVKSWQSGGSAALD